MSPLHKVIFAGNPLSYGGERILSSFFKEHGNAIIFEPMPAEYIYANILKKIFENTALEDNSQLITKYILRVYDFLCQCSRDEMLISPRELEMIALLILSHLTLHPEQSPAVVTQHYAYSIGLTFVPDDLLSEFDLQFKPTQPLISAVATSLPIHSRYLVTPSRQPLISQLQDMIALRSIRRSDRTPPLNSVQKYGGLGGIIIEGSPGIGKSQLVIDTLIANGFVKDRLPHLLHQ